MLLSLFWCVPAKKVEKWASVQIDLSQKPPAVQQLCVAQPLLLAVACIQPAGHGTRFKSAAESVVL